MGIETRHVHTLRRVRQVGSEKQAVRYMCMAPDCNFVQKRELLIGKRARCSRCGSSFILSYLQLSKETPHCGCKATRSARIIDLTQLGKELEFVAIGREEISDEVK